MFGLKKICTSVLSVRQILGRNRPTQLTQTINALRYESNCATTRGQPSFFQQYQYRFARSASKLEPTPFDVVSSCRLPPPLTKPVVPWKFPLPVEIVDAPRPRWEVTEPTCEKTSIKKEAARLIVIRRRKMKKHQLKKLRKRMFYEWAKIRHRREQRKEKAFQSELLAKMKDAEMFDAEAWVEDFVQRSNKYAREKEEEAFYNTPDGFKLKLKMLKEARYVKPANWKD